MKPEELKEKLAGVTCVMHTPFKENEDVDYEGLRKNTRFLVNAAKRHKKNLVLSPACTYGEFYHLSFEERQKVLETVIDEVNAELPVIAGPMFPSTHETLKLAKCAQSAGADGLLVAVPYYVTPSEEEMYRYFSTIAENVNIGVIIYNNVDATKHHVDPPVVSRLIENNSNIIGVKACISSFNMLYEMMKFEPKIRVLSGKGELQYAMLASLGCKGFFSGIANWYPEYPFDLADAAISQDYQKLWQLTKKMDPYREFLAKVRGKRRTTSLLGRYFVTDYSYYAVSKAVMDYRGLAGGNPRSPFLPITNDEKKELRSFLQKIGLPLE